MNVSYSLGNFSSAINVLYISEMLKNVSVMPYYFGNIQHYLIGNAGIVPDMLKTAIGVQILKVPRIFHDLRFTSLNVQAWPSYAELWAKLVSQSWVSLD